MTGAVVDTNVLVVANGGSDAVSHGCRLATVQKLSDVSECQSLILDSGGEIFREYGRHCSRSGQPGVGDEFFRWAHENQGWLQRVAVTPDANRGFQEFPTDPALATFDRADRVFVAVSITAASDNPPVPNQIVNAVDSDYSHHQRALSRVGVHVVELCASELKQQNSSRRSVSPGRRGAG